MEGKCAIISYLGVIVRGLARDSSITIVVCNLSYLFPSCCPAVDPLSTLLSAFLTSSQCPHRPLQ